MKPRKTRKSRRRRTTVKLVQGEGAERAGDEDVFVIWDTRTIIGNSAVLWAQGGEGYTCDLSRAHKYTRAEIEAKRWRETDVPVLIDDAMAASERHVRVEPLRQFIQRREAVEQATKESRNE
jgi:hypothetical protein